MAAALALGIPAAGVAGGGNQGQKDAAVPASLLEAAQANPSATFNVIVTGDNGQSSGQVGQQVNADINADNNGSGNNQGEVKQSFDSIAGVSATLTGSQLVRLAQQSSIQAIVPDAKLSTSGDPAYLNAEMWRASTQVNSLWDKPAVTCALSTLTGLQLDPSCIPAPAVLAPQAPAIAVVDSGIDATKAADFGSRIVARSNSVATEPNVVGDPDGHGTLVSGVLAGASSLYPGVAQNASLVDVRVADSTGKAMTSDIIKGIDWILANKAKYGIRVANISLAGSGESSYLVDPLDQAVEKLWLNGITVVAAAGNNGSPTGPAPLAAPGNDPFVITVGALDVNQTTTPTDDFRAPWSAYGYTADAYLKPEISAPGRFMIMPIPTGAYIASVVPTRIVSPGYMWMSGTSFAAPVVAGAAAQLLARHPDWTPDQVKGALMASASKVAAGQAGVGMGEVNATAANAVVAPPNPNENLFAFVQTDAKTSLRSFNSARWEDYVSNVANWTRSNWVSANWTTANWVKANWVSANWTAGTFVAANWVSANWVN